MSDTEERKNFVGSQHFVGFVQKAAGTPAPVRLTGSGEVNEFVAKAMNHDATQVVSVYQLVSRFERTQVWKQVEGPSPPGNGETKEADIRVGDVDPEAHAPQP